MDAADWKALRHLMTRGRATWSDLGNLLGLSAPAAAERVRRMEERGTIRGYAALVDPEAVGCGLTAFIAVSLERPGHRSAFLARVQELDAIQECHHIAGDDDYLLKVRAASPRDLDRLISQELKDLPGVVRTRTTIVLATSKESVALPLPPGGE